MILHEDMQQSLSENQSYLEDTRDCLDEAYGVQTVLGNEVAVTALNTLNYQFRLSCCRIGRLCDSPAQKVCLLQLLASTSASQVVSHHCILSCPWKQFRLPIIDASMALCHQYANNV